MCSYVSEKKFPSPYLRPVYKVVLRVVFILRSRCDPLNDHYQIHPQIKVPTSFPAKFMVAYFRQHTIESSPASAPDEGPLALAASKDAVSSTMRIFFMRLYCRLSSSRTASFVLWIRSTNTVAFCLYVIKGCWRENQSINQSLDWYSAIYTILLMIQDMVDNHKIYVRL